MTVHPPKFSVLGDSISTFQGYCPVGAEHYAPDTGAATGVYTVEGGFSQKRLRGLSVEGEGPDHILLYAGLNDANFGIPLDVFAREYQALLGNLLALYPQVQIHCGTLLLGAIAGTTNSMACFVQRLVPYNEAIRAAVQATGCHLVDLAATGSRYTALDAFHPTGEGMRQLAQLWLGAMDGEGAKK